MFRTLIKPSTINNSLKSQKFFSISARRNALSIKLNGLAEGYRQTLKVNDPVNVNHVINVNRGIKLGKAEIDIDAALAPLSKVPNEYPGFLTEKVIINYKVETDATDEQFEQLRDETEAKCPIAQVFINSKGLKFESNWTKIPLK
ncbi:hypothetical protein BN7_3467 [Wickerhamomyces ciferrii]|uniref:OsmC-like protein n=1 Tax=Wickerhamomyces ciferrii (strain ATCC 14091 / BCRC 22168 / CBS 111 / JCM 3599 / NBRC 0793 / NRRL Y-1031 F-60-10) TaxID=1206466 RepID=K0KP00_WICCF|nr:uncharacterized protein BN7_3467 [Wickerhamomyces ciferrii]CCH43912.1 hypothetical protein BN7_3467 [Wickerhamomyces ciferrii]